MNQYDLSDQIAVVTGAARGIGYAVAERFLQSGALVAIWDKDEDEVVKATKTLSDLGQVFPVPMDITNWESVLSATETTSQHFANIDILVNNAGISGPNLPLWKYPRDAWRQVVEIDLVGTFLCCQAVIPIMLKKNYGRIVNVASVAGKEGNPNASAYSAAKAGVIGLTKSLGKELADTDIRVNAISPATVKTDIFKQMSEEQIQYMLAKIPMGRFGKTEENAALISWLCSPDCSFSTAATFDISGGRTTY